MIVITAPEKYVREDGDVFCFLAGGITGCKNWQEEVIDELSRYHGTDHLIIFNPRRTEFDTSKLDSAKEQIKWEFRYLEACDIFSIYFANSPSDQPICMYELGRNIVRMHEKFPGEPHIIVSVEDGYKRIEDVAVQTSLAKMNGLFSIHANPKDHANEIYKMYNDILYERRFYD